jgi:phage terminase large subunit-like protein
MHPVTQYAIEAVERTRTVGQTERQACIRHLHDLIRAGEMEQSLIERILNATGAPVPERDENYQWTFDKTKADRIYRWYTYCHHVEGPLAGKPIVLIDAHKFDMGVIFGWVHKETGLRRFEKAYLQEGRKNAKSTRLAAVANFLMVGDGEESPAVYCAAVDKRQARIVYRSAMAMARKSPDIKKRLKIRDYEISHVTRGGQMAALSKDTKNKDGLNPTGVILDEYAAHPTSEIYDLLWSAWGQRAQALMAIITTAGMDTESPCHKEYIYCKQILTGDVINERYFVMIRELDQGDDEHEPSNWIKANPLRASSPAGLARLQEQHDEAFGSRDPAKIRTFRVKNLNIWIHGNEDTFMGDYIEKWDQLAVSREVFAELTKDSLCLVGVDLSKKIDLTADGHVFALDDGRIAVTAMGFIPEEAIKRHEKTDKIPYTEWVRAGWVIQTEGDVTDYHRVQTHIQDGELERGWKVHELCYDPYNATHFANELQELGYTTIEISQWMKILSEPTKLIRELVATGKLVHDGSPLLKWCVGNAMQIVDTKENIMISKKKAGDNRRIDLLAALINALVRIQSLKDAVDFISRVGTDDFGF